MTVPAGSTSAEFTVRTSAVSVATNINITTTASTATFTQPLNVTTQPASGAAPFGTVDTPANGATGITGSIAVTGWTLDDLGVSTVKIYRNCIAGVDAPGNCTMVDGNNVVFIGDASFLAGARPDVEALYPMYPNSVRAGWGYLMLTNMLPHVTAPVNAARRPGLDDDLRLRDRPGKPSDAARSEGHHAGQRSRHQTVWRHRHAGAGRHRPRASCRTSAGR